MFITDGDQTRADGGQAGGRKEKPDPCAWKICVGLVTFGEVRLPRLCLSFPLCLPAGRRLRQFSATMRLQGTMIY
jgi:hypothetical protein